MKWIEAKVFFESDNNTVACDLISNIFYKFDLQGVVVETPDAEPAEVWEEDIRQITDYYAVTGYFAKNDSTLKNPLRLESELLALTKKITLKFNVVYKEIDDEDWAESWKQYFWPIKITDRIVIKPSWREFAAEKDDIIIEIDPGMAFGTGTHPTTSMCVTLIEKHIQPKCSFLDIGTGSGILMIAAQKLGAADITGLDIDETAIDVAGKNLLLNRIDKTVFCLIHGTIADVRTRQFDLITANILTETVVGIMDHIKRLLADDGIAVFSGITEKNKDYVLRKMNDYGFKPIDIGIKESWVAIAGKHIR